MHPPDDIVVFLGAGFSYDAGLPLMSAFGTEARREREALEKHARSPRSRDYRNAAPRLLEAASVFERFQKTCRQSQTREACDWDNLETVFCVAEALDESGCKSMKLAGEPIELSRVVEDIMLWTWKIYQQLPALNQRPRSRPLYEKFVRLINQVNQNHRVTVVTTNYDIVFETFSFQQGLRCAYPFKWDQTFKVASGARTYVHPFDCSEAGFTVICKLHGSVNYFEDHKNCEDQIFVAADLSDGTPIGKSRIRPDSPAVLAVDAIWSIQRRFGVGRIPSIIPPSYAKLRRRPWLQDVWNAAREAISVAKQVLFIGYSMPDSDGFLPALVSGAMALREYEFPEVFVIDPSPAVHCRYERLLGSMKRNLPCLTFREAIEKQVFHDVFAGRHNK